MTYKPSATCPKCGSWNLATEPVYDDEEGWQDEYDTEEDGNSQIAVYCVTCGFYAGVIDSELRQSSHRLRDNLIAWYISSTSA